MIYHAGRRTLRLYTMKDKGRVDVGAHRIIVLERLCDKKITKTQFFYLRDKSTAIAEYNSSKARVRSAAKREWNLAARSKK